MIYITLFIFIKKGKESIFLEFEDHAIPLMEKYSGKLLYRIRPTEETFIDAEIDKKPYEMHFVSFDSEEKFKAFAQDPARKEFEHLRDDSVETMIFVKGKKL